MIWIVSMIFAVIVCGIALLVGRALRAEAEPGTPESDRALLIMGAAGVVFVLWVGLHTAVSTVRFVEAGHVLVVYQFGEIVGQRNEGLQFIAPWQNTRTESTQVQRARFEDINSFSAETQDVFITATLNYSVSPRAVQGLYREVGPNWFDKLVAARINQFFKEEAVRYQTTEIAPNREQIRIDVRDRLAEDLAQFSIDVQDLLIDDIDFRPEFKQAIEQKQIATQDALREQERVRQAQFEAEQQVERARGEAESIRIRAEGQAEANRLLAESLTQEVIQFQALDKLADNIQIALIPSGQGLIIDPATLLQQMTPTNAPQPTSTPAPAPTPTPTPTE